MMTIIEIITVCLVLKYIGLTGFQIVATFVSVFLVLAFLFWAGSQD